MTATGSHPGIPLPAHWPRRVRSAIVHAVSMANVVFTATRARAAKDPDGQIPLRAELDQRDREVTAFLDRLCRKLGRRPGHLITDHGPQFTADAFIAWCRRRGIQQRFGAIGKYGSLAVIERFIRSMKDECTRLLPIVPLARAAFGRELDQYLAWYNAERPHSRFGARTPDEIYFGRFPACRKPRFETRARWRRSSPCAAPHALIRGRLGIAIELSVEYRGGRKHLPVVSLRRVA